MVSAGILHLVVRVPLDSASTLPNIAIPVLQGLPRAIKLKWIVIADEVTLHPSKTLESFYNKIAQELSFLDLITILNDVYDAIDLVICSINRKITKNDLRKQIEVQNWDGISLCLGVFDSSEWIVYSEYPIEVARAAEIIEKMN
jgi:hypothetical protein